MPEMSAIIQSRTIPIRKIFQHLFITIVFTVLVTLASLVNASENDPEELVVSNIVVASGQGYTLKDKLKPGSRLYIDEKYKFTDVGFLNNQPYIRTANSDKSTESAQFISFQVSTAADIYVLYDRSAGDLPAWLNSFKKIKGKIKSTKPTFNIFHKRFSAGKVTLGGNEKSTSGQKMYLVAFTKANTPDAINLDPWEYLNNKCFTSSEGCVIDFSQITNLSQFEDWVLKFRTGGSKDDDYNLGFDLAYMGGKNALQVTQSDTRDPGDSRRTEAKVAHMPVGDYKIAFDIFIENVPQNFDTTISQIKCGSGKPPFIVKLTSGGGIKARSAGNTILKDDSPVFSVGWHTVEYVIDNSRGTISLSVNGESFPINNSNVETNCARISGAGPDYYLKIGLYEDQVQPGFQVGYGELRVGEL